MRLWYELRMVLIDGMYDVTMRLVDWLQERKDEVRERWVHA